MQYADAWIPFAEHMPEPNELVEVYNSLTRPLGIIMICMSDYSLAYARYHVEYWRPLTKEVHDYDEYACKGSCRSSE